MPQGIVTLKEALHIKTISDLEKLAIYFEIGATYEELKDFKEALYYYEMVHKQDPKHRDVEERLQDLRNAAGGR